MIYIMYCTGKNCCKNLQISEHCLEYDETEITINNQWKSIFNKKDSTLNLDVNKQNTFEIYHDL